MQRGVEHVATAEDEEPLALARRFESDVARAVGDVEAAKEAEALRDKVEEAVRLCPRQALSLEED